MMPSAIFTALTPSFLHLSFTEYFSAEVTTRPDHNLLFASCPLPFFWNVNSAVSVSVKSGFNLGHSMWNCRNSNQSELPKKLVVSSHLSLTLAHFNLHLSLSISCYRKHLAFLDLESLCSCWWAEWRHLPSSWFPGTGEPCPPGVMSTSSTSVSSPALNSSTNSISFIGINCFVRSTVKQILRSLLPLRHSVHASNQDNLPASFLLISASCMAF